MNIISKNVGDTIRLYLQIPDLYDNSGNSIDVFTIENIIIKKIENNVFSENNQDKIQSVFYGPRLVKITGNDVVTNKSVNFLQYPVSTITGTNHLKIDKEYFVRIKYPHIISGTYNVENCYVDYYDNDNNPISNHLFIQFPILHINNEDIEFEILDNDFNIIGKFNNGKIIIDDVPENNSPLWSDEICYFEDVATNPVDFSDLNLSNPKYLSIDQGEYIGKYLIDRLYGIEDDDDSESLNKFISFVIKGFSNANNLNNNEIFAWHIEDENGIPVFGKNGSKGCIKYIYHSPVIKEEYTNDENISLYRYYIDWNTSKDNLISEGTYSIDWCYRLSENDNIDIYSEFLFLYDDYRMSQESGKFTREDYHELVYNYIPMFYKDYEVDENINKINKSFSESIYDFKILIDQFLNLYEPYETQSKFLQYIANLFSFKLKGEDSISWRQQIEHLPLILKQKGTAQGLINICNMCGFDFKYLLFYWQVITPYLYKEYFILKNNGIEEKFHLKYNPLVQSTCYEKNKKPNYSRYKLEYYSNQYNDWIEIDVDNVFDVVYCDIYSSDKTKCYTYSKEIKWNKSEEQIQGIYNNNSILITPQANDIILLTYQYKKYPLVIDDESDAECPYLIFDEDEILKEDYILSLPLMDNRHPYDDSYMDGKLIPLVNYNIHLMPDIDSMIIADKYSEGIEINNTYNITDICQQRNPLYDPVIYGHIRTKFPWSENVYNMDEYDGSTRPSYLPEDVDDNFLDDCSCGWSSHFSIGLNLYDLSDKTIEQATNLINQFKPMHSIIHNFDYGGKFTEYCNVFDGDIVFSVKNKVQDIVTIGFYPKNISGQTLINTRKRSNRFNYFYGKFETHADDMNIYLVDILERGFINQGIKEYVEPELPLRPDSILGSKITINDSSGIHANNSYYISKIDNDKLQLRDGIDSLPLPPYTQDGPWNYTIYTRKFPYLNSTSIINENIEKLAIYVLNSNSISFSENGMLSIYEFENGENIYSIEIHSGGIPGIYNVISIKENNELIIDYPYGSVIGNVTFSVYKNGSVIENIDYVHGTIEKTKELGKFSISGIDFIEDYHVYNDDYVCIDDNEYYPIYSISENEIVFSKYAFGTEGIHKIEIYKKNIESKTGYIKIKTNIIHDITNLGYDSSSPQTVDFEKLMPLNDYDSDIDKDKLYPIKPNDDRKIKDVIIGFDLFNTGNYNYFDVSEVIDNNTLSLENIYIDEILTDVPYIIKVTELSIYEDLMPDWDYFNTIYNYGEKITDTHIGPNSNELITGNVDFESEGVTCGDIIIIRPGIDNVYAYVLDVDNTKIWLSYNVDIYTNDDIYVIKRKYYDIYTQVPQQDLVKINIDPEFEYWIPINNINEIVPGEYDIKISGKSKEERINIDKYKEYITQKFYVGPLNYIPSYMYPLDINERTVLEQTDDEEQFVIPIYDNLKIYLPSLNITINNKNAVYIEKWPDSVSPEYKNKYYYMIETIDEKYIKIIFGNGILTKKPTLADEINVIYQHYGLSSGPINNESQDQEESAFMEVRNSSGTLIQTVQLL